VHELVIIETSFNLYFIRGNRDLLLFVNTSFTNTVLIAGTTGAMFITFLTTSRVWLRVYSDSITVRLSEVDFYKPKPIGVYIADVSI